MTRDEMIKRAEELIKIKSAAEKELKGLTLVLTAGKSRGDVLKADDTTLRVCSRNQLDPDCLQKKISVSLWTSITKRIPVSSLWHSAVERGKIEQDLIDGCMTETQRWLEIR